MRRLVSTVGLEKKEWLCYRKMGITGTDAGAIVGLNPYTSAFQVFQDKLNDEIAEYDNESMRQGRDLEEYCAQRFTEETGLKIRRANAIYQNEEHPIMLADFDRLIVGEKAGLECKTVSPYSADKWADGEILAHYQMQIQHYLAVSGYDAWYIAALIFGKEFIVRKIERDEDLIRNLIIIEERFWNENIMKGIMPDPDGTKNCTELISKYYFKSDKSKAIELIGYDDMLHRRQELITLIDKMEKEKTSIEQKVKMEMQDASLATTDEFKISWNSYASKKLDTKRLKEEEPEIYEKYCNTLSLRKFTINHAA